MRLRAGLPEDLDTLCEIDSDAAALYASAGLAVDLPAEHEFCRAERERWLRSLEAGTVLIATDETGFAVGFVVAGWRDGEPYLDQLAVRRDHMRRGIGTALVEAAAAHDVLRRANWLWLTTYDHLDWNRRYYERVGFRRVSEAECGPEIRRELEFQRRHLPAPDQRIAMRRRI